MHKRFHWYGVVQYQEGVMAAIAHFKFLNAFPGIMPGY